MHVSVALREFAKIVEEIEKYFTEVFRDF